MYDPSGLELLSTAFAFITIACMISLVINLISAIGKWGLLVKAGKPGWGAIIPLYGDYLLCEITGVNSWWILIKYLGSSLSLIPILGPICSIVITLYFRILLNVSIARSFGKSDSFAIGLILLPPVFYLILGFGGDEYRGKKPMNDIIFKDSNDMQDQHQQDNVVYKDVKYCSVCGNKIMSNSNFCTNCGSKVK